MGCTSAICRPKPALKKDDSVKPIQNIDGLQVSPEIFIQQNHKKFLEVYRLDKAIGEGGFGEVRICFNKNSGIKRAVKIMQKPAKLDYETRNRFLQEIEILKRLDHPNIVRIFEFFEDRMRFYIIMEYFPGGDLVDELIKRQHFSENDAADIMSQLFSAMAYLHSKEITHRDVKPENILLASVNEDPLFIKLVDFGTATHFNKGQAAKEKLGSIFYIAPEVLEGFYTEKCDLWSCGVILYILLVGYPPFDGHDDEDILANIRGFNYSMNEAPWKNISGAAKDLVRKLLVPERRRLSAQESLKHS